MTGGADAPSLVEIGCQEAEQVRAPIDVSGRVQIFRRRLADGFEMTAAVRGNHRKPTRHCFGDREPEGFGWCGCQEHPGRRAQRLQVAPVP